MNQERRSYLLAELVRSPVDANNKIPHICVASTGEVAQKAFIYIC